MADALVDIHQQIDSLVPAKFPELFLVIRLHDGRGRRIVIQKYNNLLRIMDFLSAHLMKRADGLQIQIVNSRHIHFTIDDFSRRYRRFSGSPGQYFFYRMHETATLLILLRRFGIERNGDRTHGHKRNRGLWP